MTSPLSVEPSASELINQALQKALDHCKNNQMEKARSQYLFILQAEPHHPEANYLLGLLALQRQRPDEAIPYFESALDAKPEHGPYWLAYIDALIEIGQTDMAQQVLTMAKQAGLEGNTTDRLATRLSLEANRKEKTDPPTVPLSPPALSTLPATNPEKHISPDQKDIDTLLSLYQQEKIIECEEYARLLLHHFPQDGFSWKILGAALHQQNRIEEAIAAMRQATLLLPQDTAAHNNLGLALKNVGRLLESESSLRQALALNSNFAEAHNNLGVTLMAQERLNEAEKCFHEAHRIQPEYSESYCNLALVLKKQGRIEDAETNLRQALKFKPSSFDALNNLGNLLREQGRLFEAESAMRKAIEIRPEFAIAYNNLANILIAQGHLEESESYCHQALKRKPDYIEAYDDLLFVANYHPDREGSELFKLYSDYDQRFCLPHKNKWQAHRNTPINPPGRHASSRRLKIGYVSPAFHCHSARYFLEPLLDSHDKEHFEIFAYAEIYRQDHATSHYQSIVDHWIPTTGLPDDELAERIRNDEIDILVDLAGHTRGNRLAVFARKPAPISIHWLDFGYTTGLSAIDYYLTDVAQVPVGSEGLFSEQPWRLPTPALVYRPASDMGIVGPLPSLQKGYITFGTLSRAIRLNYRTINAWTTILRQIPNSRLIIDSSNFRDPSMIEILLDRFVTTGITTDRLQIGFHSPPWELFREMDISLDCFPHNSGTTLVESLYMGVPFITLSGPPGRGRIGSTILTGAGRPEWIATTEEEYIQKNIALASDPQALSSIRNNLRAEVKQSPLMDERGFAKKVESAYTEMFRKWENAAPALPVTTTNKIKTKNKSSKKISSPSIADLQLLTQLYAQGKSDEALGLATHLTTQFPLHGFAWKILGPLLFQQDRTQEAITAMRTAIKLLPHDAEAHANLGIALQNSNVFEEAEKSYEQALRCDGKHIQAHFNLANILATQRRFTDAEAHYQRVIKLKPDYFEAYYNLGDICKSQNMLAEAETYYQKAMELRPDSPEIYVSLGNTQKLQRQWSKAIQNFFQAIKLNPGFVTAHNNLGTCFQELNLFSLAEASFLKAIQLDPNFSAAYSNLGSLASRQCSMSKAEHYFMRALELRPDRINIHSNLLFAINYHPDKSGKEIFQHYIDFNTRFALPLQKEWQTHTNNREVNRRLKVGYVCSRFCHHPTQNFLEPLFAHHNKQRVELFAYSNTNPEDAVTDRYKQYSDHWIDTSSLNDIELTQRIRTDCIDILIDIAGHTGDNRLLVFARKPTPVSLHWLDFGYTTGLTAIDYYLTDSATVPHGSEDLFSETPWRAETPCFAYRPTAGMGEVNTLPALTKGHVTFGTLSRAVRINYRTIRVWSEILKRVPNSKLIMNSNSFHDPATQKKFTAKFNAHGIDSEQLLIGYTSPPWDILRQIDIGFDCFPHNSGTTLVENLYLGVPFITLASRPSVGRIGSSILEGIGHPEWIAQTEEEYIDKAVALASDVPKLAALRTGLRQEMAQSPIMDEPAFARKVEKAYQEMFSKWATTTLKG